MTRARKLGVAVAAALVTAALFASVTSLLRDSPAKLLDPDDRPLVERGAEVYAMQCASCHGARLQGQPDWRRRGADNRLPAPPHDARGHTWHHPDELLMKITKHGAAVVSGGAYESNMPAYADILGDADIRAVLSYIKSTWPVEIQRRHDAMNAQARSR